MLWLLACTAAKDSSAPFDCAAVAVTNEAGDPDPCDVAACETCVDTCGTGCLVLESYPPQYACDDAGSWSVYDTCPNWQAPTTPYVIEGQSLGCGDGTGAGIVASSPSAGRIDITHFDALTGCCPEGVSVEVAATESTLSLAYDLINDFCECACEIDLSYAIVEVPAGSWTLVGGPKGDTTTVEVGGR